MRKSTKISLEDCDKPLGMGEKLRILGLLSIPFLITAVLPLAYDDNPSRSKREPYFPEGLQKPVIEYKEPVFNSSNGDVLVKDRKSGGVVLHINGVDIVTGLSSEEILEQLNFDYYDIFDYYGGEEPF